MNAPLLRLSQSHLQLLEVCPPQFQRQYLEPWEALRSPDQQARLTWGNQFHRLLQQWQLGLPLDSILATDPDLTQSLSALIATVPALAHPTPNQQQEAEHSRTLQVDHNLLTVVYDLLVLKPGGAEILDWKTYPLPEKNPQKIINHWQTKLYLYVLAETTAYKPEQLSMTYWFVRLPKEPQSLSIAYSQTLHDQTHQDLTRLLAQFQHWLEQWQCHRLEFPHHAHCEHCPYHPQFQRLEPFDLPGLTAIS